MASNSVRAIFPQERRPRFGITDKAVEGVGHPARNFDKILDTERRELIFLKYSSTSPRPYRFVCSKSRQMSQQIDEAKAELKAAKSALDTALRAWDESVSELWRTSLTLTQAQKRVTRAHELLRNALSDMN